MYVYVVYLNQASKLHTVSVYSYTLMLLSVHFFSVCFFFCILYLWCIIIIIILFQVANYFRIALQIGWDYTSVLKYQSRPLDFINLVSGRSRMSLANLVFKTFNIPSRQVCLYLMFMVYLILVLFSFVLLIALKIIRFHQKVIDPTIIAFIISWINFEMSKIWEIIMPNWQKNVSVKDTKNSNFNFIGCRVLM